MEVFCVPKPLVGGFECDELDLYGIRELAYFSSIKPMRAKYIVTEYSNLIKHRHGKYSTEQYGKFEKLILSVCLVVSSFQDWRHYGFVQIKAEFR